MKCINLITTAHNLNLEEQDLSLVIERLSKAPFHTYIAISNTTSESFKNKFLRANKIKCILIPPKGAADARRKVLKFTLSSIYRRQPNYFFYCDFDKVVVAILKYSTDFEQYIIKNCCVNGYKIIGRDVDSFKSYPQTWRDTESITNKVAATIFKTDNLDITSGCCCFNEICANLINDKSIEKLTDTEWPILCKKNNKKIYYDDVSFLFFDSKYNKGKNDNNWRGYIPRLRLALRAVESFDKFKRD